MATRGVSGGKSELEYRPSWRRRRWLRSCHDCRAKMPSARWVHRQVVKKEKGKGGPRISRISADEDKTCTLFAFSYPRLSALSAVKILSFVRFWLRLTGRGRLMSDLEGRTTII